MDNPHGGDRDSVGILQQRASWGSTEERMNPETAVRKFYAAMNDQRLKVPSGTGAHNIAQAVQRSMCQDSSIDQKHCDGVYGGNYKRKEQKAQQIIDNLNAAVAWQ